MKVARFSDLNKIDDQDEFQRHSSAVTQNIVQVLSGQLSFADNFSSQTISVTFTAANTDTTVAHTLGRVPDHYLIGSKSVSCDVYTGSIAATKSSITLRATAPATVVVILT